MTIQINSGIFPTILQMALGKPVDRNDTTIENNDNTDIELFVELPRSANLLYLKKIITDNNEFEKNLLTKYAYGQKLTDEDYGNLIGIIMTSVTRNWNVNSVDGDILSPFGVEIIRDEKNGRKLALIENAIPVIRVETWECIIIDLLKVSAMDIITCFDFSKSFTRENCENDEPLKFSLGAWKFSFDEAEQRLSSSLRTAFMFTLVGYYCGDMKNNYNSFEDYFEQEFYKRVSLIFGIWSARENNEAIQYIPLYDSFYNLDGLQKESLIKILKSVLDNEEVAVDEKQVLRTKLIKSTGEFHAQRDNTSIILEETLIKPAMNFILLREKAKETLESAKLLCDENRNNDCADRCYYAMMFSLKALLEYEGKLAAWKVGQLKERETHASLEEGLKELVSEGKLSTSDETDFEYVKDKRWKCDYSLFNFSNVDAIVCVSKTRKFYDKMESITN